jgi:hypothetical protein
MERKHGVDSLYLWPIMAHLLEIDCTQRCLPIMQMEDMSIPTARRPEMGYDLNCCAAEE